jgi:hypothetical protein
VHGFRYNARVLARHVAERLGVQVARESVPRRELVPFLLRELTRAPELWAQKSYLARVVYDDGETAILPLTDFVDHPQSGCVAATIEMNAEGIVYPVVYRTERDISEHRLPPNPLNDFESEEYRREVEALL